MAQWFGLSLSFVATSHTALIVTAFEAALVFGFVNAIIKPVIGLVALPVNILTLGLFSFFVNAALFWMTSIFVPGFHVGSFFAALFGSIVMAIFAPIIHGILGLFEMI